MGWDIVVFASSSFVKDDPLQALIPGFVYYFVFLFSTVLHEAAHAWAAKRGGDLTAYHGGQVSLDPLPHIKREPFGMVVLPVLSVLVSGWPFGYASAPYDPAWASRYPKRAGWMALAGPMSNLSLVVASLLLIRVGHHFEMFYAPESVRFGELVGTNAGMLSSAAGVILGVTFSINLLLMTFNLLPFPPLDGSGVIPLFLNDRQSNQYQQMLWGNPALGWIGIIIAWQLFSYVFGPVWSFSIDWVYPGVTYR